MTAFRFSSQTLAHILFLHGMRESGSITQKELEELLTRETFSPKQLTPGAAEVIYPIDPDMIDIIVTQMKAGRRHIAISRGEDGKRYIHADFLQDAPHSFQGEDLRLLRHPETYQNHHGSKASQEPPTYSPHYFSSRSPLQ